MHIMIDLETMGTRPTAPIIAIGAVSFDEEGTRQTFYANVDLKSAVDSGAIIEPDTVMWWLQQSEEARSTLQHNRESMSDALQGFNHWLKAYEIDGVWGNGANFDNVILAEAYRRLDMKLPWHFTQDRCFRTIKSKYWYVDMVRTGTHHNAAGDAMSQANHLIRLNNEHGGVF